MILHVLNGDCALQGWRQCRLQGEAVVWRENYLQGTVPETNDMNLFNQIRAEALHKFAPTRSVDEIFQELQAMHRKLFAMQPGDQLVLWLDCCPFDQALKKQLLNLISNMPQKPQLYLVQKDVVWNQETFQQYRNWQDHPYCL